MRGGVVIVAEDGSRPCHRHCCHGHRCCGGRRLASASASLLPRPSSLWKQTARVTVIIATVAIIIPDVLLIVVGVAHGSSLRWWSTWVVVL